MASADFPASSLLNTTTAKERIYEIRTMNKKFRLACKQLLLINNLIDEVEVRYNRAVRDQRRSFRFTLRLKLCTLEGVRNQFYEYAYTKADQLEKMMLELYEKYGIVWSDGLATDEWEVSDGDTSDDDNNDVDYDDDDDSWMDNDTHDDSHPPSSAPCNQPSQPSSTDSASHSLRRSTRSRNQTSFYGMPVSHL